MTRGDDYAAACDRAAERQGLTPLVSALEARGLDVEVWQTGGFCMAAIVRTDPGWVAVTADIGAAHYTPETWETGDYAVEIAPGHDTTTDTPADPAVLAERVARYLDGQTVAYGVRLSCYLAPDGPETVLQDPAAAVAHAEHLDAVATRDSVTGRPAIRAILGGDR